MEILFLGGTSTVTGSKTLVSHQGYQVLVDCGLFQGAKHLRALNRMSLPVDVKTIDSVILTHGHLDHCGWLPILVREGFHGKIYCTAPTKKITQLILLDSGKIQEDEARNANEKEYSKHQPALPLYTVKEAEAVFPYISIVDPDEIFSLNEHFSFRFLNSGHIIGACSVSLKVGEKTIVFSGDLGQQDDVLMYAPEKPIEADFVVLESTYGNRLHPQINVQHTFERLITQTVIRGGHVIIPSFAVERVQTVMYYLWHLQKENRLPDVPFIIDTPMGIKVIDIFEDYPSWHKLSAEECSDMCEIFTMVADFAETIETIYDPQPKVVIAASGMITGGRVLSYLERYISNPKNLVLLVGYQAEGTRGRKLLEGAEEIKMYGKQYEVKAEIASIEGLSAHADQKELLGWLSAFKNPPKIIFLNHGETDAANVLKLEIEKIIDTEVIIPDLNQHFEFL
jgi:metallo-beta-lactamase family protein